MVRRTPHWRGGRSTEASTNESAVKVSIFARGFGGEQRVEGEGRSNEGRGKDGAEGVDRHAVR